jgi:hypothetical protein
MAGVVFVEKSDADRYGFQSSQAPQGIYRNGLTALDAFAAKTKGASFVDLLPRDQDAVMTALEDDTASGFDEPSAGLFFATVQRDVIEGLFADPAYGGNHDFVGWRHIRYPGAQRGYTPDELMNGTVRRPQGLRDLHRTHPGRPVSPHVDIPTQTGGENVH